MGSKIFMCTLTRVKLFMLFEFGYIERDEELSTIFPDTVHVDDGVKLLNLKNGVSKIETTVSLFYQSSSVS